MTIDPRVYPPDPLLTCLLTTSLDGIVVYRAVRDRTGRIADFEVIRCNERAAAMVGLSSEKMIRFSMLTVEPEALQNGIFDTYKRVAESGQPVQAEHYYAAGKVWMRQSLARFDDGVLASWADISPLKEAERMSRQEAELLRSVLDSSSNAIIALAAVRNALTNQIVDFRYVAHNEVNRRNMNRTDDEILGHTLLDFFPYMADTDLFGQFAAVADRGEPILFEMEFNDGGWSGWFEIGAKKWGDGIVLTLVDVNESKNHRQQIERANRDLQQANDNLRQFAYVASHDLQEPLRKIMSFGDMLRDQFAPQLGPSGQDLIGRMQVSASRMSALIRDVLAYSRITSQRETFQKVSLASLLRAIHDELLPGFRQIEAGLETTALPTVWGDRVQLRQLFNQLLTNAIKFRPDNRPLAVQITSRIVTGVDCPADLDPAKTYHEICVTDNGIGFDDKYADQIFQVFQRLHTRREYEGTGVGLAICKRVAENHYGTITASGQVGRGAIFRLYIPANE